jgi:hypothetical protein
MTDTEAKKQWCPFARYRVAGTESAVNREIRYKDEPNIAKMMNCIGSKCMAWRVSPRIDSPRRGLCGAFGASDQIFLKHTHYGPHTAMIDGTRPGESES